MNPSVEIKEKALGEAIELTRVAMSSNGQINLVAAPDAVCDFVERVYRKLCELDDEASVPSAPYPYEPNEWSLSLPGVDRSSCSIGAHRKPPQLMSFGCQGAKQI